jgi:hypothetical protein
MSTFSSNNYLFGANEKLVIKLKIHPPTMGRSAATPTTTTTILKIFKEKNVNAETLFDINTPDPKELKALYSYCNQWFLPQCSWKIPNIKQTESLDTEAKKALASKGIIGLRQSTTNNDAALTALPNCAGALVSAQLDMLALQFGYTDSSQSLGIHEKHAKTLSNYKTNLAIFDSISSNIGQRATAVVLMIAEGDKDKTYGRNLLSIMQLLNVNGVAVRVGKSKCELLKFSASISKELGRKNYAPAINKLESELSVICEKTKTALERIPTGFLGSHSVEACIKSYTDSLSLGDNKQINLIQTFTVVAEIFEKINTLVAAKLSSMATPLEIKSKLITITPLH